MKITVDTDPKTLMFEGHPDVEIIAIGDKGLQFNRRLLAIFFRNHPSLPSYWGAGTCEITRTRQVETGLTSTRAIQDEFSSGFFNADGVPCPLYCNSKTANWPRLIERVKFDPAKPLIGTNRETGQVYRYRLVGTFTPADGGEPRYHVQREGNTNILEILRSTGRVASGISGSALDFTNGPLVTAHTGLVDGFLVRVIAEDGIATKAEIV